MAVIIMVFTVGFFMISVPRIVLLACSYLIVMSAFEVRSLMMNIFEPKVIFFIV